MKTLKTLARSFFTAAWLGWKIESNWTDPFLFAIYSIVKPLAGAFILVVMYGVIAKGNFGTPIFAYLYIGNAFYRYVGDVVTGVSWAIIDDREHYRTLKYMYVAPIKIPFYLLGRGIARVATSSFSILIIMLVGVAFLNLSFDITKVDWPLFLVSLVIGIVMMAMLGLILAIILKVYSAATGILTVLIQSGFDITSISKLNLFNPSASLNRNILFLLLNGIGLIIYIPFSASIFISAYLKYSDVKLPFLMRVR